MDTCKSREKVQETKHDSVAIAPKIYKCKIVRGSASKAHNESAVNLIATDVQVQNTGRENANNVQHKDLNNTGYSFRWK